MKNNPLLIFNTMKYIKRKYLPRIVERRLHRFIIKNKEEHDRYVAIYGEAIMAYTPWTIKNIFLWIIKKGEKPGFSFINPQELYNNMEVDIEF